MGRCCVELAFEDRGNGNDDQILKFTKTGKFVMQIGKGGQKKTNADTKNLWEPADVFVYSKTNELFGRTDTATSESSYSTPTPALQPDVGRVRRQPMDDPPTPGARAQGRGHDARPPSQPMGPDGAPQFVPPVTL